MTNKIEEIRKRHEAGPIGMLPMQALAKAEDDRAALLDLAERQQADNELLLRLNKLLRAKIKWLIEDDERLHSVLYRIANPRPFADCPVEMAQNATRGEHLRREAFDGIRRALEGKP